jgi:putative pyruvate formate lyase activating enzyme
VHSEGKRVLVRHLLMPGHFDCCTRPVLEWLAGLPGVEVSLLTQYIAPPQARGELAGELQLGEIDAARALAGGELQLDEIAGARALAGELGLLLAR